MTRDRERGTSRPRRVAELIKRELAQLIQREMHDPRAGRITLTAVEVSRDLSHAKVYFTRLDGARESEGASTALNKAAGFLRHQLKERLVLRSIPELRFIYDESVERGVALSSLIDRALAGDAAGNKKDD